LCWRHLQADFEAYLDAFSPNVQEILNSFEFRNQIPRLSKADALGQLIEKFLDSSINLAPTPVLNDNGSVKLPGLDNHNMGTMFEELVRRFNEENNEEAGEHWTPRDAIRLMARPMARAGRRTVNVWEVSPASRIHVSSQNTLAMPSSRSSPDPVTDSFCFLPA